MKFPERYCRHADPQFSLHRETIFDKRQSPARWAGATVEQRRAEVIVTVYNSMPTGAVACTAIYGYTTHDVVLGSLAPGAYKVRVNDRTVDLVVP